MRFAKNPVAQQLPYERFVICPWVQHQVYQQLLHRLVVRPMLMWMIFLMLLHGCRANVLAQPAGTIHAKP